MSYMHLTCGWTGPRLMPEDACPKCGERGPWTAADEAREDSLIRMLFGAFGMMVDDLIGKPRANPVSDEGLKLLAEFVESDPSDDPHDFPYCRHCSRALIEAHDPGCLWSRARAYLRDQGVTLKDSE